jgi:Domain of Unknown Function (DUF748)
MVAARRIIPKKLLIALMVAAILLVIARALLPLGVEYYVDRQLARADAYTGAVEDVDISLIRGQYALDGLHVEKRENPLPEPFLRVPRVELGLDWSAILAGEWVGDLHATRPVIAFVDGPSPEQSQDGLGTDWAERLDRLLPFRLNSLSVKDGALALYKTGEDGTSNLLGRLHAIDVEAQNFTNIREEGEEVFGTVAITATVQDEGLLRVSAEIDPLSDPPEMSVDAQLTELPLPELNPLLEAYANLDAEAGRVEIFVEFASADGRFEGYVKPLIRDAEILNLDTDGSFFGTLWEGVVEFAKNILENDETDRLGAQVPLEGELTAVDAELIPAVFSILRNAFIEALSVGLGRTIGLGDLRDEDNDGKEADEDG